jgi:hypothetical protein
VSTLNVDKVDPSTGTTLELGSSGDTVNLGSGVTAGTGFYNDDQVQSNIAMLGFKVAVNGSLVKYNLVDQTIDEYQDASGVDASASTNEVRNASDYYSGIVTPSVTEDADDSGTDGDYTWYKWTDTASTGSYNNDTTQDHEYLIIAGGGAGGYANGGGGGAGGLLTATGLSLTGGNEYTVTVGDGGASQTTYNAQGDDGDDSILSGTGISTLTAVGGGGGSAVDPSIDEGRDGGSGGGGCNGGVGGSGTTDQGYDGGAGINAPPAYGSGGGGGAGAVGADGTSSVGGDGGIGIQSDIIETGTNVWYAGGGGGTHNVTNASGGNHGAGANGRTQGGGGTGNVGTATGNDGTNGLGSGGGGNQNDSGQDSGAGGSGVVILRRLTAAVGDLTLQSTDTTASTANPDYANMICLIENAAGTATLNTDIKGYVSEDSGVTFTQGTFVDEGTWGTNKKIIAFHDLDISAQSGSAMCYKITTHNQSAAKDTRIYATSIGWR